MGKKATDLTNLQCKICGKLATEDAHFYATKMLCNKHYIQLYRYGEITDDKPNHPTILKNKCDICGDTESHRYTIWHADDKFDGLDDGSNIIYNPENPSAKVVNILKNDVISTFTIGVIFEFARSKNVCPIMIE